MTHPTLICLLLGLTLPLAAQNIATYTAAETKDHIGEYAHVTGHVTEVHVTSKGDVFIRFGPAYPDFDFTAVIYSNDRGKFGDVTRLQARAVTVTGTIRLYHEKPEVILKRREQLEIGKE